MRGTVVVVEPELDAAIVRIRGDGITTNESPGLDLPYFDVAEAAQRPRAEPGDWVLAFGNAFEFAMRDEAVSVQRGVIAAVAKLTGRRGIFDFPYTGEVYIIDQVTNNPGAAGGALTDRKGRLLGMIGRDVKNTLTETFVNYAIPIQTPVEIRDGDKTLSLSLSDFVQKAIAGEYKPTPRTRPVAGTGGYHGIVFVPNVVERTPAYIESVRPHSPAAKAGLKPDDLVSFLDGEPIYSIKSFQEAISRIRPGTTIRLEVRRGDKLQTIELTLDEQPKAKP
jgi:serine protease Do